MLQTGQDFDGALVAELPERDRRVDLQRPVQLRHGNDGVVGVLRLVVAERLDDRAPEIVLPAADLPRQRRSHPRVAALRRERPNERRPDELADFGVERREEGRQQRRIGMMLEEAVRAGAKAVVWTAERLAHRITGPRIVEPGQQNERAVTHVAVGVLGYVIVLQL